MVYNFLCRFIGIFQGNTTIVGKKKEKRLEEL